MTFINTFLDPKFSIPIQAQINVKISLISDNPKRGANTNYCQVIVLWTANTERFCDITEGLNMTAEELLNSIQNNEEEVSPSTIFAVASILEGCTYINGSPQNTFVPGTETLSVY